MKIQNPNDTWGKSPEVGAVSNGGMTYSLAPGITTTPSKGMTWNGSAWVAPGSLAGMNYNQVVKDSNPFGDEAKRYQGSLAELLQNPGAMASNPAYQYSFDQGMEAVNRTAAARGQLGSGNRLAELTKFGQGEASKNFFNLADLYSTLSGAKNQNAAGAVNNGVNMLRAQTDAMSGGRQMKISGGLDTSQLNLINLY